MMPKHPCRPQQAPQIACHGKSTPRPPAPPDEREQVVAHDLKHHAHVAAVRAGVVKAVQQAHTGLGVVRVPISDLAEQGDLVASRLGVVRRRLDHLKGGGRGREGEKVWGTAAGGRGLAGWTGWGQPRHLFVYSGGCDAPEVYNPPRPTPCCCTPLRRPKACAPCASASTPCKGTPQPPTHPHAHHQHHTFMAACCPVALSSTIHTVEKWPHPSLCSTV